MEGVLQGHLQAVSCGHDYWEKGKEGEERSWSNRGNRVEFVKGERREVELRCMQPAREIGRMLEETGIGGMEEEFEQEKRSCFAKGVSVEAE